MKNNFPRIYSLSTIGIKSHFNCDYKFHPLRTDFSGESGSGKSMVADMIQLILVGPAAYKSSTEGNKERTAAGMVIESKGKLFGLGYIFLNIEVSPKKFVVLGSYIEQSSKHIVPFIIQAGLDWESNLSPLPRPVFYADLIFDNHVLPIESLGEKLEGSYIKSFTARKYHSLLYENGLLSIDLSQSKKTLDAFASIYRSFARGRGFKKDSESLKNFLFGDEDETNLLNKFKEEVKSINEDFHEHRRYKSEIEIIGKKQGLVSDILAKRKDFKQKEENYLVSRLLYWGQRNERLRESFSGIKQKYITAEIERLLLDIKEKEISINIVKQKWSGLERSRQQVQTFQAVNKTNQAPLLENEWRIWLRKKEKVEKLEEWIDDHSVKIGKAKERFLENKRTKDDKQQLEKFTQYLDNQRIQMAFEASDWLSDYEFAKSNYDNFVSSIQKEIDALNALSSFADFGNAKSLAGWALEYFKRALNLEEESALLYFQKFPRVIPHESQGRYLPFPEELFDSMDIKDKSNEGFWLNLNGVYEFIGYTPTPLLGISDPKNIKKSLKEAQKKAKAELDNCIKQKESARNLKEKLFSFAGLESVIKLYKKKQEVLKYQDDELSNLSETEFQEYIDLYYNKAQIFEECENAESIYLQYKRDNDNSSLLSKATSEAGSYSRFFKERRIPENNIGDHLKGQNELLESLKEKLKYAQQDYTVTDDAVNKISDILFEGTDSDEVNVLRLKNERLEAFAGIKTAYTDLQKEMEISGKEIANAELEYLAAFQKSFNQGDCLFPVPDGNPDKGDNSLKSQYEASKIAFYTTYDLATEEVEDGIQLKGTYHVPQLAHRMLPTVFDHSKIQEEHIEQNIADRLEKLNQLIREIGSRKVEILKRVFSEVHKTYSSYLEKVNGIEAYFLNENRRITGGNRATLKHRKSSDYPDRWMAPFRKQLDEQLYSDGLFAELIQEVDINEMMMKAFRAAGGTTKVIPEELLNPKSYFELDFDIHLASGDSNAGSNGQTYTANALLGLARLSLIEEKGRPGLHIMPIDEAEGLGGNYDMLYRIAEDEEYQVISMSIETAGEIEEGKQYIYIMNENPPTDALNYVPPLGIFSNNNITENIGDFVYAEI